MSAVLDILINTDADKATKELKGLEQQSKKTADATGGIERATKAANDSYKGAGGSIRNVSYQLQDFMVQVQGGTSVITALSQQLPQLLSGFGLIGVVAGVGASAIGAIVQSFDLFVSASERVKRATDASKDALELLKDSYSGLSTSTIGALKNWVDAWKTGSAEVRAELSKNLKLNVELMASELALLEARNKENRSIRAGSGTRNIFGIMTSGQAKDPERVKAAEELLRETQLREQLQVLRDRATNPTAAVPKTVEEQRSEAKSVQELIKAYDIKIAKNYAEADSLQISNLEKAKAVELAQLEIDRVRMGETAYQKYKQAIIDSVTAKNTSEEEKKLVSYNLVQEEYNKLIALEGQRATMTARDYERLVAQKQLNIQLERDTAGMSPIGEENYRKNAQAIFEYQQRLKDANDEQTRTFGGGATATLNKYAQDASNIGAQVGSAFTNAFKGMEDALVSFTMTGKASFSSFALSVVADIQRILVRQALLAPIAGGISAMFGGTTTSMLASTGFTGVAGASFSLATGTNYVPYDGLQATLHKGEAVVPKEYNPAAGGMGAGSVNNVTVQVNMNGSDQTSANSSDAKKLGITISNVVKAELIKQQRNGGLLSGA